MKGKILLVLALLLLAISASAQEYYADVVFSVSSDGSVSISGATNHPYFENRTTQELTSKQGEVWALEIAPVGDFSEYVYEIKLPAGSEIIQITTTDHYRISNEGGTLAIIATEQNTPLNIKVNYKINTTQTQNFTLTILLALLLIGIALIGGYFFSKRKGKIENIQPTREEKPKYDRDALTERQLAIVERLEKNGGKTTQAELQKTLGYPKAALSRNLDTLEKKEIISKERKGMTMLVTLKK